MTELKSFAPGGPRTEADSIGADGRDGVRVGTYVWLTRRDVGVANAGFHSANGVD